MEKKEKKPGKLVERPKLHKTPRKRYYGVDDFRGSNCSGFMRPPMKMGVYITDRECIEAGDISASPALFEN
jgi:hypothetical protein